MLDGRAHETGAVESFFTPWHAVLYSGAGLALAAIALFALRRRDAGGGWRERLPPGYGLAAVGGVLMIVAGVADMLWHEVFGIEEDLAALLSPTHLLLLSGGLLLLTAPARAAWARSGGEATWARLGPAVVSVALAATTIAFFVEFASPFHDLGPFTGGGDHGGAELGAAGVLLDTVLIVGALGLLVRRFGRLPAGAATLVVASTVALLSLAADFAVDGAVLAAIVGGVAADLLLRAATRRSPDARRLRLALALIPVPLWLSFFAVVELEAGLTWQPELWTGSTFLAALAGFGLGLLLFPGRDGPAWFAGDAREPVAAGR